MKKQVTLIMMLTAFFIGFTSIAYSAQVSKTVDQQMIRLKAPISTIKAVTNCACAANDCQCRVGQQLMCGGNTLVLENLNYHYEGNGYTVDGISFLFNGVRVALARDLNIPHLYLGVVISFTAINDALNSLSLTCLPE
jgi:hypothetical protein